MVLGMSLYSQIREAYISGESQRSIAKRLGVQTNRKEVLRRSNYARCPEGISPGPKRGYS